jgi:hypothetical protein
MAVRRLSRQDRQGTAHVNKIVFAKIYCFILRAGPRIKYRIGPITGTKITIRAIRIPSLPSNLLLRMSMRAINGSKRHPPRTKKTRIISVKPKFPMILNF